MNIYTKCFLSLQVPNFASLVPGFWSVVGVSSR